MRFGDRRARLLCVATLVVLAASAPFTSRDAAAQAVVFVSVGEPSKETVRLLAPYLDEISRREHVVALPKDARTRLGNRVPRPGRADPGLQASDLVLRYEDGLTHFRKNQWKDAAVKLSAAVAASRDNQALVVDEASHRDTWIRGLVALAMCRHRLRDATGADEINDDLARTYPNQEIMIQALSGSEATRYYAAAHARLSAKGRGKLIVEVREQAARVYLDADERPQNGVLEADVLPGLHRVLVRLPGTDGQLFDAVVEPGKATRLTVDLRFGEIFSITDRYVGLIFPSQAERHQYALDYAAQLAAGMDAGPEVIMVERTIQHGQTAFRSVIHMADSGAWVRGRVVTLDGRDDDDRMRALARETLHAHIEDARVVDLADPALPASHAPTGRAWPKWTVGTGAAVALVTGGSLLYLHQTCGPDGDACRGESPTLAYAALGAGVTLGAIATYLFLSDPPRSQGLSLSVRPAIGGAVVGFSMTY